MKGSRLPFTNTSPLQVLLERVMKKTLLLIPVLLLLVSCQSREEMFRETCARESSGGLTEKEARDKLGIKEHEGLWGFCRYYASR